MASVTACPLLQVLEPAKGLLDLGDVILNDTHVLHRFRVQNKTEGQLWVNLSCDLGEDVVKFQTSNENLSENTVVPVQNEKFNQLFNEVRVVQVVAHNIY